MKLINVFLAIYWFYVLGSFLFGKEPLKITIGAAFFITGLFFLKEAIK